jgi:hypothetical protein
MRNEIFRKIKKLNVFSLHKREKTSMGRIFEYKYHPNYMKNVHYTLVLFIHKISLSRDFRLYLHNSDGSYNDSFFQISDDSDWNINFLNEQINKIFYVEFRNLKLKKIIKKII